MTGVQTCALPISQTDSQGYWQANLGNLKQASGQPFISTSGRDLQLSLLGQPNLSLSQSLSNQPIQNMGLIQLNQTVSGQIVVADAPTRSGLGQNYPNPFNPETWIPFQLQQEANVVVDIYQSNGQRVRRLDLGWQEAGYYTTPQTSAYWDGRTELGEQVPSGLYFYTIRAGQYSQTRRMVILK